MSRLDRVYISNSGEWIDQIATVQHDSKACTSDHCPVLVDLYLTDARDNNRPWKTYLKVSTEEVKDATTRRKVVAAWRNHPRNVTDPRIKWELAWRRVKLVIKATRREKKETEVSREELEQVLEIRRGKLLLYDSEENKAGYKIAEKMIKDKDIQEAKLWKVRSGVKWISEGDAPTKFFFSVWKLLFIEEGEDSAAVADRGEVLQLVTKRVAAEDNARMEAVPTDIELEDYVQNLAKEKAPGLDGISADVLRELWSEAKTLCKQMIEMVWEDEQLTYSSKKGVIKLLAKNEETCRLTNWRPIALQGITYKLVSKILADRLKPLLPWLVSGQQTGFVPGRSIFDNILSVKFLRDKSPL
ncbi:hypothetical protein R1sor_000650 [Riccia sorocarpa]|uniref:Reverse transcriptase domain-containing protein n=1 Tax=Riccia sorocarpa TaxID=122646 RepID=A0ABD3GUJ9_9MARC